MRSAWAGQSKGPDSARFPMLYLNILLQDEAVIKAKNRRRTPFDFPSCCRTCGTTLESSSDSSVAAPVGS